MNDKINITDLLSKLSGFRANTPVENVQTHSLIKECMQALRYAKYLESTLEEEKNE